MGNRWIFALCAAISVQLTQISVYAHETEQRYNRVSLSASAELETENDVLVAVLFSEHRAQRQRVAAAEVNKAVGWALERAKAVAAVKTQTTQYGTSPLYEKNVISGWRARQSIRLESRDPEALSDLLGELQERLSIASIDYTISKSARDRVEETLISEALARFGRRAERVAKDLGRQGYRVVQINVGTQGGRSPPVAYAGRGMVAMEQSAAPAIEAGVQTLTVVVSGTIEVDADPR